MDKKRKIMKAEQKEKTFSDMVKEEIVDAMMNNYNYSKKNAIKFAETKSNRIEGHMWSTFDKEIEEKMENKNG
jgi:hypothetical protein